MQKNRLDGLRVAILVTDDFEQVEMTEPKKALEQAGATTKIISPKPGQIQGMIELFAGSKVTLQQ